MTHKYEDIQPQIQKKYTGLLDYIAYSLCHHDHCPWSADEYNCNACPFASSAQEGTVNENWKEDLIQFLIDNKEHW